MVVEEKERGISLDLDGMKHEQRWREIKKRKREIEITKREKEEEDMRK